MRSGFLDWGRYGELTVLPPEELVELPEVEDDDPWRFAREVRTALPVGFMSLVSTTLLDFRDKIALGDLMGRLPRLDATTQEGSFGALVDDLVDRPAVRDVLLAFGRLASYTAARTPSPRPHVVHQLQHALAEGVRYVDGGWQTIVDGLIAALDEACVAVELEARVSSLDGFGQADVVLAVPPAVASKLLGRRFDVRPLRAALPRSHPRRRARAPPLVRPRDRPTHLRGCRQPTRRGRARRQRGRPRPEVTSTAPAIRAPTVPRSKTPSIFCSRAGATTSLPSASSPTSPSRTPRPASDPTSSRMA